MRAFPEHVPHAIRPLLTIVIAACLSALPAIGQNARWVNAKEAYNLAGDGTTDDTEGLQKAFRASQSVFLPRGTYRFTKTLAVRANLRLSGEIGGWNPKGKTTLLYDGPEGEIALKFNEAHFSQVRDLTLDGNRKAGVGVYWRYSGNEAGLENVAIVRTRDHGLFVTRTWYAKFENVVARNNVGAGITIDRSHFPLADGPVNDVAFIRCRASSCGEADEYDGADNADKGYGLGIFGYHSVITFLSCSFEGNGGAGTYLQDGQNHLSFVGCYWEQNARSSMRRVERVAPQPDKVRQTGFPPVRDLPDTGRWASIIVNTGPSQLALVFDNCYVHGRNGIWFRGPGGGDNAVFRHMNHPAVIWSENADWELRDGHVPPIAWAAGAVYRPESGGYAWAPTTSQNAKGHPGYSLAKGKRRLVPAEPEGLHLYVNTAQGNDHNSGRTPETAWKTAQKPLRLLQDTELDTPCTIHLSGEADNLALQGIDGTGTLTLVLEEQSSVNGLTLQDVDCPVTIEATNARLHALDLRGNSQVRLQGGTVRTTADQPGLRVRGGFVHVVNTTFEENPDAASSPGILAERGARASIESSSATDCTVSLRVESGATVLLPASSSTAWPGRQTQGGLIQMMPE